MTDIDRRTLLGAAGVAGAGLVLSGCTSDCPDNAQDNGAPTTTEGPCTIYGKSVFQQHPEKENPSDFKPDYLCAAYLRFEPSGTLTVRTAHLRLTQYDDAFVKDTTR